MSRDNLTSTLRQRITIEELVKTPDGAGGFTTSWQSVATLWANVKFQSGFSRANEPFEQERLVTRKRAIATVRYQEGLDTTMRVISAGETYDITSINDPDGQKIRLKMVLVSE